MSSFFWYKIIVMKKYLLLLLLASFSVEAQIVNIPDANFKAKLLEASPSNTIAQNNSNQYIKIDINDDGEIQESEALLVYFLNINNSNIESLEGVFSFSNLAFLEARNNSIQEFVLPEGITNFGLSGIDLAHNQLTNFNFNVMYEYDMFLCDLSFNNLTVLDFTNISHIDGPVLLNNNQLDSIIFPQYGGNGNYSLIVHESGYFNIRNNNLNGIDFSGVRFSIYADGRLYYGNNSSDAVIPGRNMRLFYYSGNAEFLDIDYIDSDSYFLHLDAPNLKWLKNKNFNEMNIVSPPADWNNYEEFSPSVINFYNCPNLEYICADEGEIEHLYQLLQNSNIPEGQVHINTYCSFDDSPFGCKITGTVKYDLNGNCEEEETVLSGVKFNVVSSNNTQGLAVSNFNGSFYIPLKCFTDFENNTISHTITPILENPEYYTISPSNLEINFPGSTFQTFQNFCVTPNGSHQDVEIALIPLEVARPGFDATYKLVYKNKGNTTVSGSISLTFMDNVMDFLEANPVQSSVEPNILNWNYTNLQPFESRYITVSFNLNSPQETPALNGGDVLNFTAIIDPISGDQMVSDNTSTLNQEVVNSFDPNDKTCLEGSVVSTALIGQYVHYVIRFENTGTFFAQNVVVKDEIDVSKFDLNSLIVLSTSHQQWTRINGNKVEFIFENIQLPFPPSEERHGYIAFKIKLKNNLTLGDTFSNFASIYFDYNFPIITEPATTTIEALSNPDFEFSNFVKLYPNPASATIIIESQTINLKSVEIFNSLGQLIQAIPNDNNQLSIDVSNLLTGTYFVKVHSDRGIGVSKFVKQ